MRREGIGKKKEGKGKEKKGREKRNRLSIFRNCD
jgi:hypothetical protein